MNKRPMTIVLTVSEDTNYGGLGLCLPRVQDGYDPAKDGLTVAHDLLEHQNGPQEIGGIADELEALGAIWYVRGQFHDLRRDGTGSRYTAHESIGADVRRMFEDFVNGAYLGTDVPRTRACDADFADIIREAKLEEVSLDDIGWDATRDELIAMRRAYTAICLPRLRIGYRKAAKRFGDARRANDLFWEIAGVVDRAIGLNGSYRMNDPRNLEHEGQTVTLTYSMNDGGPHVTCHDSTYDEESEAA